MEPERPIEKLLRTFAKKRREQASESVELHSAMRQQLHREIARRAQANTGGGFFAKFSSGLRPRLALAACFTAVVVVAGFLLLPLIKAPKPEKLSAAHLEMKKGRPPEAVPAAPTPLSAASAPSVAPAPPAGISDENQKAISANGSQRGHLKMEPLGQPVISEVQSSSEVTKDTAVQTNLGMQMAALSTPPSTAPMPVPGAGDVPHSIGGRLSVKSETPAQPKLEAAPSLNMNTSAPPPATLTKNRTETKSLLFASTPGATQTSDTAASYNLTKAEGSAPETVISQHFHRLNLPANSPRAAGASMAPVPVLASFRVEQNSNQLRIVDSDGSVYTGTVQVVTAGAAGYWAAPTATFKEHAAAADDLAASSLQNYFFRVAGTNRNLNQNVVFTGNFIPLTNTPSRRANTRPVNEMIPANRSTPAPKNLLSNARISGHLKIGEQKEIEVNAMPAK